MNFGTLPSFRLKSHFHNQTPPDFVLTLILTLTLTLMVNAKPIMVERFRNNYRARRQLSQGFLSSIEKINYCFA